MWPQCGIDEVETPPNCLGVNSKGSRFREVKQAQHRYRNFKSEGFENAQSRSWKQSLVELATPTDLTLCQVVTSWHCKTGATSETRYLDISWYISIHLAHLPSAWISLPDLQPPGAPSIGDKTDWEYTFSCAPNIEWMNLKSTLDFANCETKACETRGHWDALRCTGHFISTLWCAKTPHETHSDSIAKEKIHKPDP